MAASENPHAHTALVRSAAGTATAPLPFFFLDRYVPAYLAQWEAFVAACRAGAPGSPGLADARAPLVIGLAAQRSRAEGRRVEIAEIEAEVVARRSASTCSRWAGSASTSTRSSPASGWRTSRRSPSRSAARRPTSRSPRRGWATALRS